MDLGGGLRLARRRLEKGYTGYFEGRSFHILSEKNSLDQSFSDSQGKILGQLIQKKAMTPKQISDAVSITPAGVLYNLRGLIEEGVVERHALPGGTVFYVLCWDVRMDLPPALKTKIEADVSRLGGWAELGKIPMRQLRKELGKISEEEFMEVMRHLIGED